MPRFMIRSRSVLPSTDPLWKWDWWRSRGLQLIGNVGGVNIGKREMHSSKCSISLLTESVNHFRFCKLSRTKRWEKAEEIYFPSYLIEFCFLLECYCSAIASKKHCFQLKVLRWGNMHQEPLELNNHTFATSRTSSALIYACRWGRRKNNIHIRFESRRTIVVALQKLRNVGWNSHRSLQNESSVRNGEVKRCGNHLPFISMFVLACTHQCERVCTSNECFAVQMITHCKDSGESAG